jgi:2-polyprenyl-3-methyl-5-hydroxy-6-metoxy-1,4-benzoquinol methylase
MSVANNPSPAEAYDTWHSALDVDVGADSPWHRLVKGVLIPTRDLEGREVLEIGCGRGGFSCWLAARANIRQQIAMDYSQGAIDKARAYAAGVGLGSIVWEHGDIQNIARPDGVFDTVISCETIEHVPDPARAVRELARVLRPGGRLFLTTPNYMGTLGLYRAYLRLRGRVFTEVGQPINQLTLLPRTMMWLRQAGLHVETIDAVGHYLPFPGRSPIHLPAALDRIGWVSRWAALHSMFVAERR